MGSFKSKLKNQYEEKTIQKTYIDVSQTKNYSYCCFAKCRIANLKRYFLLHLLLIFGLVDYFVVCASYSHLSLIILSGLFYGLVFVSLIVLALTDPGIIPKFICQYEQPSLKNIPFSPEYFTRDPKKQSEIIYSYGITQNNFISQINYCYECCQYKPPRASHCYSCRACIKKRDHHCPWIGTCVAKNNYKYFLFYVGLSVIFLGLMLGQGIYALYMIKASGFEDKVVFFALNIALVIPSGLGFLFTTYVLIVCLCLIKKEQSIYESHWKTWSRGVNPYQKQSWIKNCLKIMKAPVITMIDPTIQLIERRRYYLQQTTQNFTEMQITNYQGPKEIKEQKIHQSQQVQNQQIREYNSQMRM